jgi:hypothetical protein
MKAIQTEYNEYLFRSRLEARWAIFFDACGIEWEYEPEGLILSDGTYYLPDFYLLDFNCYFEVKRKSMKEDAEEEIRKISNGRDTDEWAGIVCFGDPMDDDLRIFCQETDDSGGGGYEDTLTIGLDPITGVPCLFAYGDRRKRNFYTSFGKDAKIIPLQTNEYGKYTYDDFVDKHILRARKLARQARFEHGEKPRRVSL